MKKFSWQERTVCLILIALVWGVSMVCAWKNRHFHSELPAWVTDLRVKVEQGETEGLRSKGEIYAKEGFSYFVVDTRTVTPIFREGVVAKDGTQSGTGAITNWQIDVSGPAQVKRFSFRRFIDLFRNKKGQVSKDASATGNGTNRYITYVNADELIVPNDFEFVHKNTEKRSEYALELYKLLAYEAYHRENNSFLGIGDWGVGVGALLLFLLCAFWYVIYLVRQDVFLHASWQVMIAFCQLLHIGLVSLAVYIFQKNLGGAPSFYLFAILPYALVSALLANLLCRRVGICAAIFLSAMTPLLVGGDFQFQIFAEALLCSMAGVFVFQYIQERKQLLIGAIVLLVLIVVFDGYFVWSRGVGDTIKFNSVFGVKIAVFAIVQVLLTMVLIYILPLGMERLFGVTTAATWNELNNPKNTHELLSRLQREAPGTYSHCTGVTTIAEAAANAIGADPIICRVCSQFHDIGKLENPKYFAENLVQGEVSPHATLQPRESCEIIRRHVIEGRKMAAKYHLPLIVQEACEQHHGNGIMTAFYNNAVNEADANNVERPNPDDFRYHVPQPIHPEVVLVAMADCVDAAFRANKKSWAAEGKPITPELIREFVQKLLLDKIQEGLFSQSDMTMAQFYQATESIIGSLCSDNHVRPEYSKIKKDIEKEKPEEKRG